ncbi:MAG: YceI family protein [Actinomycetota bacterium]|nr:YceI family protein [Actinomycetota bacterium]
MSTATTSAAPAAVTFPASTWAVDPIHSSIGFEVRHFGISTFRGRFTGYEGTIVTGDGTIEQVEGRVRVDSVDVRDEQLAAHLQSPDFLDAESHPEIAFASTGVRELGDGRFELAGELTIRGVTRPVTLDVTADGAGPDPYGGERISLAGSGAIDRFEYGVPFDARTPTGALVAGERVRLVLSVEAVREA